MIPTTRLSNRTLILIASAAVVVAFIARVIDHAAQSWEIELVAELALLVAAGFILVVVGRSATRHDVERIGHRLQTEVKAVGEQGREAVEQNRVKQSRHEYLQERSLERLERGMATLTAATLPAPPQRHDGPARVLFVTSNGGGLGHLTRLMAVAEQMEAETEFVTLSTAADTARRRGHTVHYFPSSDVAGLETPLWNRLFTGYLTDFVASHRPDLMVFDGTWVYPGVTQAARLAGIPLVWMQRGCWKPSADTSQRDAAAEVCDMVIIPGDYGCDEVYPQGTNVPVRRVAPISLVTREDMSSRKDALAALGLDPAHRHVLIQLGSGKLNDTAALRTQAVKAVQGLGPEWVPVVTKSPLSTDPDIEGAVAVVSYPIAQHFAAFDAAIVAAGYNAVTECVGLGLPSVVVPNPDMLTDDQTRRAKGVADAGLAEIAEEGDAIGPALERLRERGDWEPAPEPVGAVEGAQHLVSFLRMHAALRNPNVDVA